MSLQPLAGQPAPASVLVNVPRLVTAYHAERPNPYKSYAESFLGPEHLHLIQNEARALIANAFATARA